MRDTKRIDLFLQDLGEIWKNDFPDWRFGQLIMNFLGELKNDPFYYEEDRLMEELIKFRNKIKKRDS